MSWQPLATEETVLDLAGVTIPDIVQGKSLLPAANDNACTGIEVVFSSLPLYNVDDRTGVVDHYMRDVIEYQPVSIVSGKWNLHFAAEGEPVELHNLETDSKQTNDISASRGDVVRELHARFVELLDSCPISTSLNQVRKSL